MMDDTIINIKGNHYRLVTKSIAQVVDMSHPCDECALSPVNDSCNDEMYDKCTDNDNQAGSDHIVVYEEIDPLYADLIKAKEADDGTKR
jgi:hypothetical protein